MNEPAASPALLASLAGQTPLPHLGVILAHGDDGEADAVAEGADAVAV